MGNDAPFRPYHDPLRHAPVLVACLCQTDLPSFAELAHDLHLVVVALFSSYHERLLMVRWEQGGGISSAGTDRRPDLRFVIAVLDYPGLPVLNEEEPINQPVNFGSHVTEKRAHVCAPGPATDTLHFCPCEHRDPVIKPGAVANDIVLPGKGLNGSFMDAVDGIVGIPARNYPVCHLFCHS